VTAHRARPFRAGAVVHRHCPVRPTDDRRLRVPRPSPASQVRPESNAVGLPGVAGIAGPLDASRSGTGADQGVDQGAPRARCAARQSSVRHDTTNHDRKPHDRR
jgi:hypothetical protein